MTKTRQEERLEELEKNQEMMITKIDWLSSKVDGLFLELLEKLLMASNQKNSFIELPYDPAILSTANSTNTKQPSAVGGDDTNTQQSLHDKNLCSMKKVEMTNFDGELRVQAVGEKQQDFHDVQFSKEVSEQHRLKLVPESQQVLNYVTPNSAANENDSIITSSD
ncbi:predicted protein [Arabidopsis lyrata subsp. lyrata]|uniref:Predicted protein n=1 Tax=Arabidopsis lyrata subsp. lyrata TaxID=81972 RepID=D7KAS6_ARALL|nr:predicted protein [Arabidopsis lyrata subsp. lyrata]